MGPLLAGFSRDTIRRTSPFQPRWTEPRRVGKAYAVGDGEPLTGKTYLSEKKESVLSINLFIDHPSFAK